MDSLIPEFTHPLKDQNVEVFEAAVDVLNNAQALLESQVTAGYVYDRKGFATFDSMDRPRNMSYGHSTDDVFISIAFVVPRNSLQVEFLESCVAEDVERANQAKIQQIENEIRIKEAEIAKLKEQL